jgi:hypothetical protein
MVLSVLFLCVIAVALVLIGRWAFPNSPDHWLLSCSAFDPGPVLFSSTLALAVTLVGVPPLLFCMTVLRAARQRRRRHLATLALLVILSVAVLATCLLYTDAQQMVAGEVYGSEQLHGILLIGVDAGGLLILFWTGRAIARLFRRRLRSPEPLY